MNKSYTGTVDIEIVLSPVLVCITGIPNQVIINIRLKRADSNETSVKIQL